MAIVIGRPPDGNPRDPDIAVTWFVPPIAVVIEILIANDFPRNISDGLCTIISTITILAPLIKIIVSV